MISLPVCWPEGLLAWPSSCPGSCAAETCGARDSQGPYAASGPASLPQGSTSSPLHCVSPVCPPLLVPCIPASHVTMFCWIRSMSQSGGAAGFSGAFLRASPRASWFPLTLLLLWASLAWASQDPRPLCQYCDLEIMLLLGPCPIPQVCLLTPRC